MVRGLRKAIAARIYTVLKMVKIQTKNPSLGNTVCHHSASLEMPIGDPWDNPGTHDRFLLFLSGVQ